MKLIKTKAKVTCEIDPKNIFQWWGDRGTVDWKGTGVVFWDAGHILPFDY